MFFQDIQGKSLETSNLNSRPVDNRIAIQQSSIIDMKSAHHKCHLNPECT